MQLNEQAEELLETLWMNEEEDKKESYFTDNLNAEGRAAADLLLKAGYVSSSNKGIKLTESGRPEAASVVRRHRLAERLLVDVLDNREDALTHDKACKFEHLLDRGLDEKICILLGHPRVCPHGKRIPQGRCCQQEQTRPQKLVSPLSQLIPQQKGRVAYIYAQESSKLQKLIAMGIYPGAQIKLIQNFPSYVFQAGQTQFAVDKEIADAIYVRLVGEETPHVEEPPHRRRRRFGMWRQRQNQI